MHFQGNQRKFAAHIQPRISLQTKLTFNVASGVASLRGRFEYCRNAWNSGQPDTRRGEKGGNVSEFYFIRASG